MRGEDRYKKGEYIKEKSRKIQKKKKKKKKLYIRF